MIKMTRNVNGTELSVELQPPYVQAMAEYLAAERLLSDGLPQAAHANTTPAQEADEKETPEKKERSPRKGTSRKSAPTMFPEGEEVQAEPVEDGAEEHEVAEALATKRAAEDLAKAEAEAKAKTEAEAKAKAEAEAKAKAEAEDAPTADDLRAALQKFIQTNGAAAGKAFLTNAGYTKVSDVPADAIAGLIAAMEL